MVSAVTPDTADFTNQMREFSPTRATRGANIDLKIKKITSRILALSRGQGVRGTFAPINDVTAI
jgi:hypothetical protein